MDEKEPTEKWIDTRTIAGKELKAIGGCEREAMTHEQVRQAVETCSEMRYPGFSRRVSIGGSWGSSAGSPDSIREPKDGPPAGAFGKIEVF